MGDRRGYAVYRNHPAGLWLEFRGSRDIGNPRTKRTRGKVGRTAGVDRGPFSLGIRQAAGYKSEPSRDTKRRFSRCQKSGGFPSVFRYAGLGGPRPKGLVGECAPARSKLRSFSWENAVLHLSLERRGRISGRHILGNFCRVAPPTRRSPFKAAEGSLDFVMRGKFAPALSEICRPSDRGRQCPAQS
jgi:hypothetical protein